MSRRGNRPSRAPPGLRGRLVALAARPGRARVTARFRLHLARVPAATGKDPGRISGFLSERYDAAVQVDADAGTAGVQRADSDTVAFGVIAALTATMFLLFVVVLAAS